MQLTQIDRRTKETPGRSHQTRSRDGSQVDADALAETLRATLTERSVSMQAVAPYMRPMVEYRQVPIGVVIPRTIEDVVQTVAACRRFEAPVLSRGGGTSLAGQTCNVAVVMDFSKYVNQLLELDPDRRRARVRPGLVLDVSPECGGAAPFNLCARPFDSQSLHIGRNDGQQLVRRTFGHGRRYCGQCRTA